MLVVAKRKSSHWVDLVFDKLSAHGYQLTVLALYETQLRHAFSYQQIPQRVANTLKEILELEWSQHPVSPVLFSEA